MSPDTPFTTPAMTMVAPMIGGSGSPPTHSLWDSSLPPFRSHPGRVGTLDVLGPNMMYCVAEREYRPVLQGEAGNSVVAW